MELCHRSKRHGIPVASSIYDLSVQPPHIPARNAHHTGNTAPAGTANTGGLVMANLASDNNNLTLAHQLNALNTQVRFRTLIYFHYLLPLPSNRQHLSYDVCLEVRGEIVRTVLCCIVY